MDETAPGFPLYIHLESSSALSKPGKARKDQEARLAMLIAPLKLVYT